MNALDPWAGRARWRFGATEMAYRVSERPDAIEVTLTADGGPAVPLAVEKSVTPARRGRAAHRGVSAARGSGAGRLDGRWAVQWNLALTAGAAPGRYYRLPGRPSLGSRGARAARARPRHGRRVARRRARRSADAGPATSRGRRWRRCPSPKPGSSASIRAPRSSWRWPLASGARRDRERRLSLALPASLGVVRLRRLGGAVLTCREHDRNCYAAKRLQRLDPRRDRTQRKMEEHDGA